MPGMTTDRIGRPPAPMTAMMKSEGYIPVSEAAGLIGMTPQAVRQAAKNGRFRSQKLSKFTFVHRAEMLQAFGYTEVMVRKLAAHAREDGE